MLGRRLSGKTLGVVGFGRIGCAVAKRAHHGFGMRIVYHTRGTPSEEAVASVEAESRSLVDLLGEADVVSLHTPAAPETRHLIDATTLRRMKPDAYLINTARGEIVDESALVEALIEGRLAGAGLDVYEREPAVHPALVDLPNVVLLPHLGSATTESRTAMGMLAVENLSAFFAGEEPPNRIA